MSEAQRSNVTGVLFLQGVEKSDVVKENRQGDDFADFLRGISRFGSLPLVSASGQGFYFIFL